MAVNVYKRQESIWYSDTPVVRHGWFVSDMFAEGVPVTGFLSEKVKAEYVEAVGKAIHGMSLPFDVREYLNADTVACFAWLVNGNEGNNEAIAALKQLYLEMGADEQNYAVAWAVLLPITTQFEARSDEKD